MTWGDAIRALPAVQPDAVSRDAVMQLLQEWTYCCDVEDVVRALIDKPGKEVDDER